MQRETNSGLGAWAVPAAAVVITVLFVWGGHWVIQRREVRLLEPPTTQGEDPVAAALERGKWLFWTRGRCHTCHSIDGRGHAPRGPNLGSDDRGPAIGARAESRARQRARQLGTTVSATDYLVESLLDPGSYLVDGYRNEMPPAQDPPSVLEPEDIRSLVAYMQSLGGSVDLSSIRLPGDAPAETASEPSTQAH